MLAPVPAFADHEIGQLRYPGNACSSGVLKPLPDPQVTEITPPCDSRHFAARPCFVRFQGVPSQCRRRMLPWANRSRITAF